MSRVFFAEYQFELDVKLSGVLSSQIAKRIVYAAIIAIVGTCFSSFLQAQDITAQIQANNNVTVNGNAVINLPGGTITYAATGGISGVGTLQIGGTGTLVLEQVNYLALPNPIETFTNPYINYTAYNYEGYYGSVFHGTVNIQQNLDSPVVTINNGVTLTIGQGANGDANIVNAVPGGNIDNIEDDGLLVFDNTYPYLSVGVISGTGSIEVNTSCSLFGTNTFSGVLVTSTGVNLGSDHNYGSIPNASAVFNNGSFIIATPVINSMELPQSIYETQFGNDINIGQYGGLIIFDGQYSFSDSGNEFAPSLTDVTQNYTINHNGSARGVNIYGEPVQFGDGNTTNYFLPGNPYNTYLNLEQGMPDLTQPLTGVPSGGILSFDYSANGSTYMNNIISGGGITFGQGINGSSYSEPGLGVVIVHQGHLVVTEQQYYNGITQIDSGASLQLGDDTHGDLGTNGGHLYETSGGDGFLMQAGQSVTIPYYSLSDFSGSSTGYAGQNITINGVPQTLNVCGVPLTNGNEMINNGTLIVDNTGATQFLNISGPGQFVQAGSGTTSLLANMTYTGSTTISGGTLVIGSHCAISNSAAVDLETTQLSLLAGPQDAAASQMARGTSTFDISAGSQLIQDLIGAAGTTVQLGASTLTFGTGDSTVVNSSIAGTGGTLVKVGSGAVTLGGTNTFTGGFNIDDGSVSISNNAALGIGNVNLGTGNGSGAILGTAGGNRSIDIGGNFIQNQDGILVLNINGTSPGSSSDMLTVSGSLTINSNSRLTLNSTLPTLSNPVVLVLASAGSLTNGSHFTLTSTSTSLGEGASFSFGSNQATINYGTLPGYANKITLTLVGSNVASTPVSTSTPTALPPPNPTRRQRRHPGRTSVPTPTPAPSTERIFPTPAPDDPGEWGL